MIVVQKIAGLATIQDAGRVGYASHAVPRGGALVGSMLACANAAVGNDEGEAAIEIFGRLVIVAEQDVVVATERADARILSAGEVLAIEPDANVRVRYFALAGGVDAPRVLGSRSTLAACGIGAPLRAGDRVASRTPSNTTATQRAFTAAPNPIRIIEGPDAIEDALEKFLARPWRIAAASNRVGTRLEGDPIARAARDVLPSSPMIVGAIQLPAGGAPIVIGPDGPTTGGYPIIAVVADLDRFHAHPLGARVSFAHT